MKAPQLFTCLGLALAVLLHAGESQAFQEGGKTREKQPTLAKKNDDPKFKYYEASTLSGIDLQANVKTGTFILKFDQQLTEAGTLVIKNTAGKVLYTNVIGEGNDPLTRTMDVGKLRPGVYSIEVKTSDTTFWKKVRIKS